MDPSADLTLWGLQGALWPNTQSGQGHFCLMCHFGFVFYGAAPPFGGGRERESSVDFLNIVLRPRPTGNIPRSSAWHPRHKHDAPGARSFYLEASAANPLTQLCQSLQMLILLPKTAFSPLRLRPFFCAGPSICTCIFISPGHSGVTLSVYTSPTTTLWYP